MPTAPIDVLLAATPLPTVIIDQGEWIVAANPEARELLGLDIVGRHFANVLRQPQVIEAIEATAQDGHEHKARHLISHGAQETPLDVTCRHVADISPDFPSVVVVSFQDRTDMEQVGQMRRDFVANVSHELRTPLTALIGFVETLRGAARDDPAARDRFLATMETEAGRMNRLVGELLSLSRVEAEERVRPTGRVDLAELLVATLTTLKPLADQARVGLLLEAAGERVEIAGDDDQLRQVFTNLVENAIKYGGPDRQVTVKMRNLDRDPVLRTAAVEVSVIDQGPGIEAVHLPRLTERFYRVDGHRSRRLGGTGLGLAIAKHIINRHRGRLKVDSEIGQGSVFTVILPRG